jgi:pimeloyl-ACP methyl ester carboxylesterase
VLRLKKFSLKNLIITYNPFSQHSIWLIWGTTSGWATAEVPDTQTSTSLCNFQIQSTGTTRKRYSLGGTLNERMIFSWDDLAAYDLKTSLRKVADETGMTRSIIHIGHSKGSALMLLFASEFPNEANEFLRGVIALCPVGYFDYVWYMKPLVRPICTLTVIYQNLEFKRKSYRYFQKFLKVLHVPALFSNIELTTRVLQILCTFLPHVCRFSINLVCGETTQFLPVIFCIIQPSGKNYQSILARFVNFL